MCFSSVPFVPSSFDFCKAHCTYTCKNSPKVGNLTFRNRVVSVLVIRLKPPCLLFILDCQSSFKKMKVNLPCHTITLWVWRFSLRDTSIHVKQCLDANAKKTKRFSLPSHTTICLKCELSEGEEIYCKASLVGNHRAMPSSPRMDGCAVAIFKFQRCKACCHSQHLSTGPLFQKS